MHRERRVDGDLRERLGEQIGEVELWVFKVEDARGERSAEARRVGRREAVQRLAVADPQRIVDVLGRQRLAPAMLLELDGLLHEVAKAVLDVRSKRVGHLVLEACYPHRLRDHLDRIARHHRHRTTAGLCREPDRERREERRLSAPRRVRLVRPVGYENFLLRCAGVAHTDGRCPRAPRFFALTL